MMLRLLWETFRFCHFQGELIAEDLKRTGSK